jgi:DNA transformation protein
MAERNDKVRKRLAAGKLRLRIRDLRNLGPSAELRLASVGIDSVAVLRARGAVGAFLALKAAGLSPTLNQLWALQGALDPWPEGRDWREVARSELRVPLLLAVNADHKKTQTAVEQVWVPGMPFD